MARGNKIPTATTMFSGLIIFSMAITFMSLGVAIANTVWPKKGWKPETAPIRATQQSECAFPHFSSTWYTHWSPTLSARLAPYAGNRNMAVVKPEVVTCEARYRKNSHNHLEALGLAQFSGINADINANGQHNTFDHHKPNGVTFKTCWRGLLPTINMAVKKRKYFQFGSVAYIRAM